MPATEVTYEIVPAMSVALTGAENTDGFYVLADSLHLMHPNGKPRWFATRASARKRISREKKGNFHS